jgi:hypothetical protein
MLSGAVAQYGRGVGMIQATAAQIIGQFATNLRTHLEQRPPATAPVPPAPTTPIAPQRSPNPVSAPQRNVTPPPPEEPLPPAAKPISGLSLMARVICDRLATLFRRRD